MSSIELFAAMAPQGWCGPAPRRWPTWETAVCACMVRRSTSRMEGWRMNGCGKARRNSASLVANIPDVTWTSALDGEKPYVSPNVVHVFGFTAEEMCDKSDGFWYGRIHPSEATAIAEAFRKLFTEGQPFDVEYRAQCKDGRWVWVHDRAYRTYEKDGVRYADGIFSDITERKRAEEERERLATLVDSSSDAILGKTLDGIITAWNPGAERLFGYSASEAVGRPMLIPPDRRGEESDILARLRRGERIEHFETVRVRKNGERIDVSVTISPGRLRLRRFGPSKKPAARFPATA
jgi:PAS domain S-box-containing protein